MAKVSVDVMWPGVSTSWPNSLKIAHKYATNISGCVWNVGFVIKGALGLLIYRNTAALYTGMKNQNGLNQCLPWRVISLRSPRNPLRPILPWSRKKLIPKTKTMTMRICPQWFQHIGSLVLFLCISQSLYRLLLAVVSMLLIFHSLQGC